MGERCNPGQVRFGFRPARSGFDLAPRFYPALSSLQRFVRCSPILGQRELEFPGLLAQLGGGAEEPFISEIGTLLPIAIARGSG
ncbi:hypothetical protein CO657_31305 (plasmid) [Rhizobium acidisoli]|uniref:Uncharacterized protein n=1 Tax=Rhizobium acidisoli TaxID=1538158 RepID=A0AAE5WTM7_9HYPH|nr:hypothetical protein CO657_31305 [Rhizobium acidisoli]